MLGRMQALGFELRTEASLTALEREILTTSAIEGERLDAAEVRSSLARRLGLDAARRLDHEVASFLTWFERHSNCDPLLKAGIAHLHFVTIHPFEDGNGRIARAVAELALARADGAGERYFSMSSQIEAERKDYYEQLESAQRGGLDVTAWLAWFLGCLQRAVAQSDALLAAVYRKAEVWRRLQGRPVNERQRVVVSRLLDGFLRHLTTAKYATLAKCSTDTALRDVRELVEWGVLVRNPGGGRSTSYGLGGR